MCNYCNADNTKKNYDYRNANVILMVNDNNGF